MADEHPAFAARPHKPHQANSTLAERKAARTKRVGKAENKAVQETDDTKTDEKPAKRKARK